MTTESPTIINDEKPVSPHSVPEKKKRSFLCILIALILIVGIIACAIGYFSLYRKTIALKQNIAEIQTTTGNTNSAITNLQNDMHQVDAIAQKSQQVSQHQEQVMAEWTAAAQGDLNKWRVVEAQYLVRMANNQIKYSNDNALALNLLQEADSLLQTVPDAQNLRQNIADASVKLQSLPPVDATSLYTRLIALDKQVDSLSLQSYPLKENTINNNPSQTQTQTQTQIQTESLPWWKAGLKRAWNALSQLVVIRNTNTAPLPLILPDEKLFLYQNLHAEFSNAIYGVLHKNPEIYQTSLTRIHDWITQYFDSEADNTKAMLQNISELQKINLASTAIPDLNATVASFEQYFAQKPSPKTP